MKKFGAHLQAFRLLSAARSATRRRSSTALFHATRCQATLSSPKHVIGAIIEDALMSNV